jgi:cysteinyl-tRNA synthetase
MVAEDNTARTELEMIVEPLLVERSLARDSKNWARADEIRNELSALGVKVKDGPDGPVWELK